MLARYTRVILIAELLAYAASGYLLVTEYGWTILSSVLLFAGIGLSLRALVVGASFVFAQRHDTARPREAAIGILQGARVFLAETAAFLAAYSFLAPLGDSIGARLRRSAPQPGAMPVLFVHGFLCNAAFWWPFSRYLARHGYTQVFTMNLEPLFGNIADYRTQLANRVERILRVTGQRKLIIIAHSMGGLVTRRYLEDAQNTDKVAKLITLGTPHHGTAHACLSHRKPVREMRQTSPWLTKLNDHQEGALPVPVLSVYSHHDNIVAPRDSARLMGAENISVIGQGHFTLLFSRKLHRLVLQELVRTSPATGTAERAA